MKPYLWLLTVGSLVLTISCRTKKTVPWHTYKETCCDFALNIDAEDLCIDTVGFHGGRSVHQSDYDTVLNIYTTSGYYPYPNLASDHPVFSRTIRYNDFNFGKSMVYDLRDCHLERMTFYYWTKRCEVDNQSTLDQPVFKDTLVFSTGNKVGKTLYLDNQGNITKQIDHEDREHYPICIHEALAIVEKHKKKYRDTSSGAKISRVKYKVGFLRLRKIYFWAISTGDYFYYIDSQTGELLGASMEMTKREAMKSAGQKIKYEKKRFFTNVVPLEDIE